MSGNVDHPAAHELFLFIENDGDLYRQQYQPILKNLVTKQAKGVYDKDKAIKLWMYLVELGAKKYVREYGSGAWHEMFNVPTRREVAVQLNDHFLTESALGAYVSLLPKKYSAAAVAARAARKLRVSAGIWKPDTVGDYWYVINMTTGEKVKIGRIGGPRGNMKGINYYDRAVQEANRRNGGVEYAWQQHNYSEAAKASLSGGKRRHPGLGVKVAAHRRARAKVTGHKRHWPDVLPDTPRKVRRGGKRRASPAGLIKAAKALKQAWR